MMSDSTVLVGATTIYTHIHTSLKKMLFDHNHINLLVRSKSGFFFFFFEFSSRLEPLSHAFRVKLTLSSNGGEATKLFLNFPSLVKD